MADVIIAGAGIAGIATACELSTKHGLKNVTLVDPRPPLTLTSDKSGANYREWWPQPPMASLVRRSVELMTSRYRSGAGFYMNRRGYLYVTKDRDRARTLPDTAETYRAAGIRQIRIHGPRPLSEPYAPPVAEGLTGPDGADILLSPSLIHQAFPHLSDQVTGAIHARNAGSVDPVGLGRHLLAVAEERGVRVLRGEVTGVETSGSRVCAVVVTTGDGSRRVETDRFVNAAGPFLRRICNLADAAIPVPVVTVLQQKVWLPDPRNILPADAPFTISLDPMALDWTPGERRQLSESPGMIPIPELLPPGLHIKPESAGGRPGIKLGWAFNQQAEEPSWEPRCSPGFPRVVLWGASRLVRGLDAYLRDIPAPVTQTSGYYTNTSDDLPLIGPMGPDGMFVVGGLAGYGAMAACAVGEIAAAWIAGSARPALAAEFVPERFTDSAYLQRVRANRKPTGAL